jgi:lipopolysaccharide export system permease protein
MSDQEDLSKKKFKRKVIGFQPTLDWYVLREFMLPFIVLIMGFSVMFLIGDLFDDLEDFTSHNATLAITVEYFLLKLPGNIRFILPISVLLACMFTMANFGKNLEITAMRASGISLQRCCGSIYLVAMIVALINCWFNESLVPYTERKAYSIRKKTKTDGYWTGLRKNLSYRSPDGRRTWLFNNFDANGIQRQVYLKNFYKDGSLEWELTAKTAEFIPGKGWKFSNGQKADFDTVNNLPGASKRFKEIIKGVDEFPESPRDIMMAVKEIDDLASWEIFEIIYKTHNMPAKRKALYWTTLYYRLSFFPFACIIAAFLGVPLATKNERSGIFISIISAVLVIMGYMVFSSISRLLGNMGILPPLLAGAGPTAALVLYGWYNVIRQN